jgi:hypothetical protein
VIVRLLDADPQSTGRFPLLILYIKQLLCPFSRALQNLTSLHPLPCLKMVLKVAFDFLNVLNMWFLKNRKVSIIVYDIVYISIIGTCWEMWDYGRLLRSFWVISERIFPQSIHSHCREAHGLGAPYLSTLPPSDLWEATLCATHHSGLLVLASIRLANERFWPEIRDWLDEHFWKFPSTLASFLPLSQTQWLQSWA